MVRDTAGEVGKLRWGLGPVTELYADMLCLPVLSHLDQHI